MDHETQTDHQAGLAASLRRLLGSFVGVAWTRFDLLSVEFAEERLNLVKLLMVALGAIFCLQMGVILGVVFLVLAVGQENRVLALGIAAAALLLAGIGGTFYLVRWLKTRPPLFAATMAELRKDRERLRIRD